jgi:hypothetical protein
MLQLDDLDDPAKISSGPFSLLPAVAAVEVEFCKSWLAFFWGRAALANICPQVRLNATSENTFHSSVCLICNPQ